jgi:hypothetical protein
MAELGWISLVDDAVEVTVEAQHAVDAVLLGWCDRRRVSEAMLSGFVSETRLQIR